MGPTRYAEFCFTKNWQNDAKVLLTKAGTLNTVQYSYNIKQFARYWREKRKEKKKSPDQIKNNSSLG